MAVYFLNFFLMLGFFADRTPHVEGQTLNQSIELMNEMLKGYDRRHRPIENQSMTLQVNVTFDIIAIQDFDEVTSLFSVVGLVYISWYDSKIVWDPALYGGIVSQLYQLSDVWYPALVLANPYDSATDIATNSTFVRFYFNGLAAFVPGSVFRTTCSVDVTYYPFDTQTCDIRLLPWGYFTTELTLYSPRTDVLQTYYTGNGEWTMVSTKAYRDELNTVWFTFTLRRKPLFLIVNVLLPVIFLAFINTLVFMLPCDSGERISYCITVLLSIAVFLTLVGDNLPKTSEPISSLSYYLMMILVLSTLICLAVILNMNLFHRKDQIRVSWWGKALVSLLSCRCVKKNKITDESGASHPKDDDKSQVPTKEFVKSTFANYQSSHVPASRDKDGDAITWKAVSSAVDKLCVCLFVGVNIILAAVFLAVLTSYDA